MLRGVEDVDYNVVVTTSQLTTSAVDTILQLSHTKTTV